MKRLFLPLLSALLVTGCVLPPVGTGFTVYHNGTIYTDPAADPVPAVNVFGGRVVATIGESINERVLAQLQEEGYTLIDLEGAVAIPGLQDAHGHVSGLGGALEEVDLVGAASYAEVIDRIAARAGQQPAGSWVTGRGWDQTLWPERTFPQHQPLSEAVPDHPVLVRRVDGHAALANRAALDIAGLSERVHMPEVEGGRVVVDDFGRPTGVLIDTAIGLVGRHVPPTDEETLRRRILLAQEKLLSEGIVAVHDMGVSAAEAEVFVELEEDGLLKMRVLSYLWGNDGIAPEVAERFPRKRDFDVSSKLRVVGAKLMMDGALGSRGAALMEPYSDAPDETGLLRMSPEVFRQRVYEVVAAGLRPATHAIGDRANRIVLDVYVELLEATPELADLRPRVEHAQIVSQADWERFDAHGIVPSMQPTHATSDMRWAEDRVGPERVLGAYAWRRLSVDPTRLAFGSDFPVERSNPLEGLYAARTRQDAAGNPVGGWFPDQCLDGAEAVAAFTQGAAYAVHEEEWRGLLTEGHACDMTVLSVDPITCTPAALLDAEVLMTVVDGEVVYRKNAQE